MTSFSVLPTLSGATGAPPEEARRCGTMFLQGAPTPGVNPIEALVAGVQALPPGIRWLNNVERTIRAHACGLPVERGPRSRAAAGLLAIAGIFGLAGWAAQQMGFCLLGLLYVQMLRVRSADSLKNTVFVGIGAIRETALQRELAEERQEPVTFLNETSVASFAQHFKPGWRELLREWKAISHDARAQLSDRDLRGLSARDRRVAFVTEAHRFVWCRAWFRMLRRRGTREPVVFSAASAVAHAAATAGLRAAYHLHGFQCRSLVYPEFEEVRCFTEPEQQHLASRLPRARVLLSREQSTLIETKRAVAVAGCYGQRVGFEDCIAFVEWARRRNIAVILRPHPRDHSGFFERWRGSEGVTWSESAVPFEEFLETARPRLLLSWYSTALYDALRRGIVPVTVRTEEWRSLDMVFPFREISLHWPGDETEAARFMDGDARMHAFLAAKRQACGIAP